MAATSWTATLDKIAQHDAFYNVQSNHRVDIATYGVGQPDSQLDAEILRLEGRVNARLDEVRMTPYSILIFNCQHPLDSATEHSFIRHYGTGF
jgi:hypothetical protein